MTTKIRLPAPLAHIVAEYAAQWTILPWVEKQLPKFKPAQEKCTGPFLVHGHCISSHDGAKGILTNPKAEDWIRGREIYRSDAHLLAENPADWALDILEQFIAGYGNSVVPVLHLCRNTNPRAMAILARFDPKLYDWGWLSANPAAIDLLRAHPENIDHEWIMHNPAAESLIKEQKIELDIIGTQNNPADWAMSWFFSQPNWTSEISGGFASNPHPRAIEQIKVHINDIDSTEILCNPAALHIVRDNPDLFPVDRDIVVNPAIFEPTIPAGIEAAVMYV